MQQQAQQQALLAQAAATKGRMPRAKNDSKPRGRMTAYAFFVQTCREEHKKKHPDENVVFAAFSKKCAERWNVSVFHLIKIMYFLSFVILVLYSYLNQG